MGKDSKDVSQPRLDVHCKAHGAPGCLFAVGAYRDAGEVDPEPGTFGHREGTFGHRALGAGGSGSHDLIFDWCI